MGKHLVDIDEDVLDAAKAQLRTKTIKDTVNVALRRVVPDRDQRVDRALLELARRDLADRHDAWR